MNVVMVMADRGVGEDSAPAVQGVRQPREGAQVHHSARRAAEGPRLDGRSRLTKEGRLSNCCMHNQLILFLIVSDPINGVHNVWMRFRVSQECMTDQFYHVMAARFRESASG